MKKYNKIPAVSFSSTSFFKIKEGRAHNPADNRLILNTEVSANVLHNIMELTYFLILVRSANFIAKNPPNEQPNK